MNNKEIEIENILLSCKQYASNTINNNINFISDALERGKDIVFLTVLYRAFDDYLEVDTSSIRKKNDGIELLWERYEPIFKKYCRIVTSFKLFEKKYLNKAMDNYYNELCLELQLKISDECDECDDLILNLTDAGKEEYFYPAEWIKALGLKKNEFKIFVNEIVLPKLKKDYEEKINNKLKSRGLKKTEMVKPNLKIPTATIDQDDFIDKYKKLKEVSLAEATQKCMEIEDKSNFKKKRKDICTKYLSKHSIKGKPGYKPEKLANRISTQRYKEKQ